MIEEGAEEEGREIGEGRRWQGKGRMSGKGGKNESPWFLLKPTPV